MKPETKKGKFRCSECGETFEVESDAWMHAAWSDSCGIIEEVQEEKKP